MNFENIIYIDYYSILEFKNVYSSDFIDDGIINGNIAYHFQLLNRKLKNANNKSIYDDDYYKELDDFKSKIDALIGGEFRYDKFDNRFLFTEDGEDYQMENTASGLKQLRILQLLLKNRYLTENSFLIYWMMMRLLKFMII